MNTSIFVKELSAIGLILGLILLGSSTSWPQQKAGALAKQLHGQWSLVSIDALEQGVRKTGSFGPHPEGLFIFDPGGRYAFQMFRPDMPKFASNNRLTGTAEENKAVVQGTLAHFGTYTVNEKEGSFSLRIEASSFPNWSGAEQPARKFTITGNALTITNPASSRGSGTSYLILKRAK